MENSLTELSRWGEGVADNTVRGNSDRGALPAIGGAVEEFLHQEGLPNAVR